MLAPTPITQLPELPEGPSFDRVRAPVDFPTYDPFWIVLVLIAGCLVFGFLGWALLRRRHQQQAIPIDPYQRAKNTILSAAKPDQSNAHFAVQTSTALRNYLEATRCRQYKGKTSSELLEAFSKNEHFEPIFQEKLRDLLVVFDELKFAQASISNEQRQAITDAAIELIDRDEHTTKKESPSP